MTASVIASVLVIAAAVAVRCVWRSRFPMRPGPALVVALLAGVGSAFTPTLVVGTFAAAAAAVALGVASGPRSPVPAVLAWWARRLIGSWRNGGAS
jgi:hypothetical protein